VQWPSRPENSRVRTASPREAAGEIARRGLETEGANKQKPKEDMHDTAVHPTNPLMLITASHFPARELIRPTALGEDQHQFALPAKGTQLFNSTYGRRSRSFITSHSQEGHKLHRTSNSLVIPPHNLKYGYYYRRYSTE
ncbi:unnamed protein product, partial [Ectocarpus sp. 8 AP-2014]